VIAPNGVDLDRYANLPAAHEARKKLGLADRTTASYTGHFYAGRGLEILYHLAESFPQVQFLWVGGRETELANVRIELKKRGIANVILTGFIDNMDLPLYQAASEVLLMPYERSIAGSSGGNSADICSPMKMFEYMAAGRVILTSDLPVIREVLDDTIAVFCQPEDKTAWQEAFARILRTPAMESMGELARSRSASFDILARQSKILSTIAGAII
jgi:glycosyltransferase involved in cell wall biosynthesis